MNRDPHDMVISVCSDLYIFVHQKSFEILQNISKFCCDSIADLCRTVGTTDILGANSVLNGSSHCFFDSLSFSWEIERVFEHHSHGEDCADWIDKSFARDIWGRSFKNKSVLRTPLKVQQSHRGLARRCHCICLHLGYRSSLHLVKVQYFLE